MTKSEQLRRKAAQARRAASIKTEGGQSADRRLVEMAMKLDEEADCLHIMQKIDDVQYWRDRAEEARNVAENFGDQNARDQMLELAAGYDRLAKMVEDADQKAAQKAY